jgi:hypothetical protein
MDISKQKNISGDPKLAKPIASVSWLLLSDLNSLVTSKKLLPCFIFTVFVSETVLSSGSVSTDSTKDEEESQEFKSFIQSVKPSDFEKLLKQNPESDQ